MAAVDYANRLWVFDTSSLISVRELVSGRLEQATWGRIEKVAQDKRIIWPPEVTHEIERGAPSDLARTFVRMYRDICERPATLDAVRSVLRVAPTLIDTEGTHDQADPYVIALALDSTDLLAVPSIVTDDRRDKPTYVSLATAAGILSVPSVPLRGFLMAEGIGP